MELDYIKFCWIIRTHYICTFIDSSEGEWGKNKVAVYKNCDSIYMHDVFNEFLFIGFLVKLKSNSQLPTPMWNNAEKDFEEKQMSFTM